MTDSSFHRSIDGLRNKHLFYREILVWVEGPTDVAFFRGVIEKSRIRLEAAGGRPQCENLINALLEDDLPYVVVLDGDYDCLLARTQVDERVIQLERYSHENYFAEPAVVGQIKQPLFCKFSYPSIGTIAPL